MALPLPVQPFCKGWTSHTRGVHATYQIRQRACTGRMHMRCTFRVLICSGPACSVKILHRAAMNVKLWAELPTPRLSFTQTAAHQSLVLYAMVDAEIVQANTSTDNCCSAVKADFQRPPQQPPASHKNAKRAFYWHSCGALHIIIRIMLYGS